jgi:hypothetical protein
MILTTAVYIYIIVYVTLCSGNRIDTFIDCDALDERYKFFIVPAVKN